MEKVQKSERKEKGDKNTDLKGKEKKGAYEKKDQVLP